MGKYISLKEIEYRKTKLEEQKQQLEDKARKENLADCSYTWTMYKSLSQNSVLRVIAETRIKESEQELKELEDGRCNS